MNESERNLRIAVASDTADGADSPVSAHFGRCPAYTFAHVKGGEVDGYRVVENPHFVNHEPGAVPAFLHGEGVDVVLSGGMGPRAVGLFSDLGIQVATGARGSVATAVGEWLSGRLRGTAPCAHDHPDSCGGHGEKVLTNHERRERVDAPGPARMSAPQDVGRGSGHVPHLVGPSDDTGRDAGARAVARGLSTPSEGRA